MLKLQMCLLSLLFLFPAISQSQENNIQSELNNADKYIQTQNFDQAMNHIENALGIDPENLDALEKRINVYVLTDRGKVALKEIEGKIDSDSENPKYYYLRALALTHLNKYSKAIDDYASAIRYDLDQSQVHKLFIHRGIVYMNLQEFEYAEEDFKQAIDLAPSNATAFHSYGMLKYQIKDYEAAVSYFTKAIELEKSNSITYYNLAMAYYRLEQSDNACYYFNKSCSMGHRNACRLLLLECTEEINLPQ